MTRPKVKTRMTVERAKADAQTIAQLAKADAEAARSAERELWVSVLETIAAGCNSWGAKALAKEALKTRDIDFKGF